MDKHKLDAFFYPVQMPYYAQENFAKDQFAYIASNAGIPAVVIRGPMTTHDVPRATFLQLIGHKFDEKTLLAIIAQYDRLGLPQRPNKIQSTGGLSFDDIASFNSYKQKIGPALYQYMKAHNLNTDTLTKEKFHDFLLSI